MPKKQWIQNPATLSTTKRKQNITFGSIHKIFNKSTIKLSYSWVLKYQMKIKQSQQKKMLQPKSTEPQKLCNCLGKQDCQMNGLCIKCSDSKCKQKDTRESVKCHSRNVMETTKNHSMQLSLIMAPPYLLNIGT